jgi:hypothetical protein
MPEEVDIAVDQAISETKADCEARHTAALDHIVKEAEQAADQAVAEALAASTKGGGHVVSTPEKLERARRYAAEIYSTPTSRQTPTRTSRQQQPGEDQLGEAATPVRQLLRSTELQPR